MGFLEDGIWKDQWYDTKATGGHFQRKQSQFRNWITPDGSPGASGEGGFRAERDRYHLYISLACPWAHRTFIFRKLKKLEDIISLSIVESYMGSEGWTFGEEEGSIKDSINNSKRLYEIYVAADPHYTGRVTVPVLWDKQTKTIVNNESSEIIRMFNTAFNEFTDVKDDFYPSNLQEEIDKINSFVYDNVNNGVYKAGFATKQEVYETEVKNIFKALDEIEKRLENQRYLVGNVLTEADWRLFTTLVRFDSVYVGHFKCNIRRIEDYSNLSNYLRELYQYPGVSDTVDFNHIKKHYYQSHININPTGIVPVGPLLDLTTSHNRERISKQSSSPSK